MKQGIRRAIAITALSIAGAWAGALIIEVGKADTDPEAKSINAVLIARMTACHKPEESTVTASFVRPRNGRLERTSLKVVPLKTAGSFAVVGAAPAGSVIDIAVTNPEYKNYQPHLLIRNGEHGLEWAAIRRFFGTPPTEADVHTLLQQTVAVN